MEELTTPDSGAQVRGDLQIIAPVRINVVNHMRPTAHLLSDYQLQTYKERCREEAALESAWHVPLGIAVTLLIAVVTGPPRGFLLSGASWQSLFVVALLHFTARTISLYIRGRRHMPLDLLEEAGDGEGRACAE